MTASDRGIVALVSTAVTSDHSGASVGATSIGATLSRGACGGPSTHDTSAAGTSAAVASSSASAVAAFIARSLRLVVSPASLVIARSAAIVRSTRPAPTSTAAASTSSRRAEPLPVVLGQCVGQLAGTGFEVADEPLVGHDRLRRPGQGDEAAAAQLDARGGGDDLFELVGLVEDHDVVLGQHAAAGGEMQAVEVGVDDEHVGGGGLGAGSFGEAGLADGTARRARTLPGAHRQCRPRRPRRLEGELGAVAGGRLGAPLDQAEQLAPRGPVGERIDTRHRHARRLPSPPPSTSFARWRHR